MRVSIVQGGGFLPIATTTVADSAALSAEDASALAAKVDESGLFGLTSSAGQAEPDRPSYDITVEDEGRRNQVTLGDAALPEAVRSLVAWISSVPGHEQRIAPLGR